MYWRIQHCTMDLFFYGAEQFWLQQKEKRELILIFFPTRQFSFHSHCAGHCRQKPTRWSEWGGRIKHDDTREYKSVIFITDWLRIWLEWQAAWGLFSMRLLLFFWEPIYFAILPQTSKLYTKPRTLSRTFLACCPQNEVRSHLRVKL